MDGGAWGVTIRGATEVRTKHIEKGPHSAQRKEQIYNLPETNGFVSEIHTEIHWLG